jgi:hypothetical protein
MNQVELEDNIARLEERERRQKFGLQQQFMQLEVQMKPGKIIQRMVKRSLLKVKSFLLDFSFKPTARP